MKTISDTILVHNLTFIGPHGYYPEERENGNRFSVDLEATVSTFAASQEDDLAKSIDYRRLASIVLEIGEGPSVFLVETLAERICAKILRDLTSVLAVEITLRKFASGVPGDPAWVGVRIKRFR